MSTPPPRSPSLPPPLAERRASSPTDGSDATKSVSSTPGRKRSHESTSRLPVRISPDPTGQPAQAETVSPTGETPTEAPPSPALSSQREEQRRKQMKSTQIHHAPDAGTRGREQMEKAAAEETRPDPRQEIEPFDWLEFESRYLKAVEEQDKIQRVILDDFQGMMNFFGVWAMSSVDHENDRSAKRIKTRTTYVQGAEESLQEKREHYVKVVAAFESALALLGGK